MIKRIFSGIYYRIRLMYSAYIRPFFLIRHATVECPYCGWRGTHFLPGGAEIRKNARCPRCGSLERHRLYYLYLKQILPKDKPLQVLHFAPEKIITGLFKSYKNINYLSTDPGPLKAMEKIDITNIPYPENSFDVIFCSHVLEHIPDDKKAMLEIYRVLKPGGFSILQVPIKDVFNGIKIETTYEDPSVTDPVERKMVFGQEDHVRIYGRDYEQRLANAGFQVKVDKFAGMLGEEKIKKHGLMSEEITGNETDGWVFFCTK
jgi:hypothetical protein